MAEERGQGRSANPEEIHKLHGILSRDPRSRVFPRLAEALRREGHLDEAIAVCRRGLEHLPDYQSGLVALARALFEKGLHGEARQEISKVVRVSPDNLMAQKLLGRIELELGNRDVAEKAFAMALMLDPRDQEAQGYLDSLKEPAAPSEEEEPAMEVSPPPIPAPAGEAVEAPAEEAPGEPEGPEWLADEGGETLFGDEEEPSVHGTEPVFDLSDMETMARSAEEDLPHEPAPGEEESPFEIFTKEPRDVEAPAAGPAPAPAGEAQEGEDVTYEQIFAAGDLDAGAVEEPREPAAPPPAEEPPVLFDEEIEEAGEIGDETLAIEEMPLFDMDEEAEPPEEPGEVPLVDLDEEIETVEAAAPQAVKEGAPTGVFDTETLAELYIRQGFHEKAADVYRRLLKERPRDDGLRQRLQEVLQLQRMTASSAEEPALFGPPSAEPARPAVEEPAPEATGEDESVIAELQDFLNKLKERRSEFQGRSR